MSESQHPNNELPTDAEQSSTTMTTTFPDKFTFDTIPESLDEQYADRDTIKDILECTVDYYHEQLPDYVRDLVTLKWGITDDVIDELKLGYSSDNHGLISHLRKEGFHPVEMVRAGIGSNALFKHVYTCDPDEDACFHDFSNEIDALARARETEEIPREAIDMYAVYNHFLEDNDFLPISDWWDNRVIFPYKNKDGEYIYMIARETVWSDDRDGKYLKQSAKKPYISDAVYEPMYGANTATEGEPLLLTEGITDAIMAHQYNFNCISPVTKKFKKAHYDQLLEHAERSSGVVIINDNEISGEGIKGALDTGMFLRENGVKANIGILPRNDDEEKVDLAEFLRTNNREDLVDVLKSKTPDNPQGSVKPTDHPAYEKMEEREQERLGKNPDDTGSTKLGIENADTDGNNSALYEAKLSEVLDVRTGYRGDHPVRHHGESHSGYFVVYEENGEVRARDFKKGYNYNALTWLAVASGARQPSQPAGKLNDKETWEVWKYAKEQNYLPEDDPVPTRAIWHIARKHDLTMEDMIPNSYEEEKMLPETVYNNVLNTIEAQYNLDHGRHKIPTDG